MTKPSRAREAALFIHGLPEDARTQVLARLDGEERAQIDPLLLELVSLGIPRLPHHELSSRPVDLAVQSSVEQAAQLSTTQVLAVLADANVITLALLLRVTDWPWRGDLLASLDDTKREQVLALNRSTADGTVAPAIADALSRRLIEQAGQISMKQPPLSTTRLPRRRWFTWKK